MVRAKLIIKKQDWSVGRTGGEHVVERGKDLKKKGFTLETWVSPAGRQEFARADTRRRDEGAMCSICSERRRRGL